MKKNFVSVEYTSKKIDVEPKDIMREHNYLDDTIVSSPHRKAIGLSRGLHLVYDDSEEIIDYGFDKTLMNIVVSRLKPFLNYEAK